MTPTEKIVLSRIKESFGLKLTPKSWKMILQQLNRHKMKQPKDSDPKNIQRIELVKGKDPLS
jgi:hypothetical protein